VVYPLLFREADGKALDADQQSKKITLRRIAKNKCELGPFNPG